MLSLKSLDIVGSRSELASIPDGKTLINTINAHSYNVAQKDALFAEALTRCDFLIPDGASIVKACRFLGAKSQPCERIAGWDLFKAEMDRLETGGAAGGNCQRRVLFVGSTDKVLSLIREKASHEYPHLGVETYSPPYKAAFSEEESAAIVDVINSSDPDLLWIGMTAPKQEKWIWSHWNELDIHCHCGCIGAVFDFYAGTAKRAPLWWQKHSLEWLYRLIKEPGRMWRRYLVGNTRFIASMISEKLNHEL